MKPSEQTKLVEVIKKKLSELEVEITQAKEDTKPIAPDSSLGRLTRMEAINAKSIKEANLRSAEARQRLLTSALYKLEANDPDFGTCIECGEEIPVKRLLARPESTRCVDCAAG